MKVENKIKNQQGLGRRRDLCQYFLRKCSFNHLSMTWLGKQVPFFWLTVFEVASPLSLTRNCTSKAKKSNSQRKNKNYLSGSTHYIFCMLEGHTPLKMQTYFILLTPLREAPIALLTSPYLTSALKTCRFIPAFLLHSQ